MNVDLVRVGHPFHFAATGASGVPVPIDADPDTGGVDAGARPMELLLMGLAGCAAIEVVEIIGKQRLDLKEIAVTVSAERASGVPSIFTAVHLAFTLAGDIPEEKARRAIALSLETYCPAAAVIGATAAIDYTLTIVPAAAPAS